MTGAYKAKMAPKAKKKTMSLSDFLKTEESKTEPNLT